MVTAELAVHVAAMNSSAAEDGQPTEKGPNRGRRHFLIILGCFFLSGFAGLIYETAWTQEFTLVFGATEMAAATVLAAYMAGLAMGAGLAGKWVDAIRRPVLAYAFLELGIGISALAVPLAVRLAGSLQVALFGGEEMATGSHISLMLYDFFTSFLILMIPTGFMGATLPFLARYAVRRERQIGPRVGFLYTMNTIGAAIGAMVAVFWLLPALGLGSTVMTAVGLNFLVFGAALPLAGPAGESRPRPSLADAAPPRSTGAWVLPLILLSGVVSFALEILWTRLLTHVLGGSMYAFGTMLAIFLTGIALGAGIAGRWAKTRRRAQIGFVLAQLGIAFLSMAAFAMADRLPSLASHLAPGQKYFLLRGAVLSALTLLPGAMCSGATFPLAVKILTPDAPSAGRSSARVLAWNTLGAICGAVAAGFFLIPGLGFQGTIRATTTASLLLALAAIFFCRGGTGEGAARPEFAATRRRQPMSMGSIVALLVVFLGLVFALFFPPGTPWQLLKSSALTSSPKAGDVAYLGVGRGATVLVSRHGLDWRLSTNGLPESIIQGKGSRSGRLAIARWLSLLPLAARPDSRNMLIIGLGAGVTVESVPSSVCEIQVVELEPEILYANQVMKDRRRSDPLSDPRVRVSFNDARSALLLSEKRYDAIISQPSHPWTGAASHLFTLEFFRLVQSRLQPDGVFCQWIGLNFVDEALLKTLVATLRGVFPQVEVFAPAKRTALLFLASNQPLVDLASAREAISLAPDQWSRIGVSRPEDILISKELDSPGGERFSRDAALNRDRRNLLQIHSPQLLGQPISRGRIDRMFAPWDPLTRETPGLDRVYMVRALLGRNQAARARRVAFASSSPFDRQVGQGLIALARGKQAAGVRILTRIAERNPGHREATGALLRFFRGGPGEERQLARMVPYLSDHGLALVRAWELERSEDWQGVQEMDESLAIEDPSHPLFRDAIVVRVKWRLAEGSPARAREAFTLIESLMENPANVHDLLLRARVALAVADDDVTLASFFEIAQFLRAAPAGQIPAGLERFSAELRGLVARLSPEKRQWLEASIPMPFNGESLEAMSSLETTNGEP